MANCVKSSRQVVVTGMGIVSCLGVGVRTVWKRLLEGQVGISKIDNTKHGYNFDQIPCKVAGFVPRGNSDGCFHDELIPAVDKRAATEMTKYCLVAAEEALEMAKWRPSKPSERQRTGVCIGTGMVPLEEIVDAGEQLRGGKYRRISPWFIPRILVNMTAGCVSLAYGFQGPNHAVSTACTTSLHAIGDASRLIQYGSADVVVCGGCEASVTPLGMAGFSRMRALSTSFNDEPELASRPFDAKRDGFVMSEGAGVLVLEEMNHAKARGATIYAEVLGYGMSGDANHLTAPCEDGNGALRCMQTAVDDAGVSLEHVGHINCHATSTPLGDTAESQAIVSLFGRHAENNILVSSTKGATGHLLGAAGSVEALFTVLAVHEGVAPPTANLDQPATDCDLNYVRGAPATWSSENSALRRRIALTNSFGFGGTNATLCFSEHR